MCNSSTDEQELGLDGAASPEVEPEIEPIVVQSDDAAIMCMPHIPALRIPLPGDTNLVVPPAVRDAELMIQVAWVAKTTGDAHILRSSEEAIASILQPESNAVQSGRAAAASLDVDRKQWREVNKLVVAAAEQYERQQWRAIERGVINRAAAREDTQLWVHTTPVAYDGVDLPLRSHGRPSNGLDPVLRLLAAISKHHSQCIVQQLQKGVKLPLVLIHPLV